MLPAPCDVLVVGDPQHLIYFANYVQSPFVFRSADAGAVLILEPGKATLVSDNVVEPFWAAAAVVNKTIAASQLAACMQRFRG